MMNLLPREVDPYRLAQEGVSYAGPVSLVEMLRLFPLLTEGKGAVMAEIHFGLDYEGNPFVKGQLTGELVLVCQRCLQGMHFPIDINFSLAPIRSEKACTELSTEYEPLLVQSESVSLSDLLEDELLLALPFSPLHPTVECPTKITTDSLSSPDQTDSRRLHSVLASAADTD